MLNIEYIPEAQIIRLAISVRGDQVGPGSVPLAENEKLIANLAASEVPILREKTIADAHGLRRWSSTGQCHLVDASNFSTIEELLAKATAGFTPTADAVGPGFFRGFDPQPYKYFWADSSFAELTAYYSAAAAPASAALP
jgi:hypothetical protein